MHRRLATRDPFVVGVVGNLDPGAESFAANLCRFAADPRFRGIRISPDQFGGFDDRRLVDAMWTCCGADRLIYGSNWPVSESVADGATVLQLVLDYFGQHGEEAARKFFSLNARRAYRWPEAR